MKKFYKSLNGDIILDIENKKYYMVSDKIFIIQVPMFWEFNISDNGDSLKIEDDCLADFGYLWRLYEEGKDVEDSKFGEWFMFKKLEYITFNSISEEEFLDSIKDIDFKEPE